MGAREKQIAEDVRACVREGMKNSEIATVLGISQSSVMNYKSKLGLCSQSQSKAEDVKRLHDEGKTQQEIAYELGITKQRVSQYLRRNEIPRKNMSQEDMETIRECFRLGVRTDDIAKKIGRNRETVLRFILKENLRANVPVKAEEEKAEEKMTEVMPVETVEKVTNLFESFSIMLDGESARYRIVSGGKVRIVCGDLGMEMEISKLERFGTECIEIAKRFGGMRI